MQGWITTVSILCLLAFIKTSTAQPELQKCGLYTDPHITKFHFLDQARISYMDCLDDGPLTVLRGPLVSMTVEVLNKWMVDINFSFRNRSNAPTFCTIDSYNFVLGMSSDCARGGVHANITDGSNYLTLTVTYEAARIAIIATHYKWWNILHYNIEIWMPSDIVALTSGVCNSNNCGGTGIGKRSVRSIQDIINNATNVSNETAGWICDTYIQTFLNNTSHTSASRDVHYNATISNARDMCIYDVTNFGAAAGTGILDALMIEDLTTGIRNLTEITSTFDIALPTAVNSLRNAVSEANIRIAALLANMTLETTTTVATVSTATANATAVTATRTTPATVPDTVTATRTSENSITTTTNGSNPLFFFSFALMTLMLLTNTLFNE